MAIVTPTNHDSYTDRWNHTALAGAWHRDQWPVLCALLLLSGLAWAATIYQAGSMGWGLVTCSMTMGTSFSIQSGLLYVALWGVMMVAMMFPAIAPMVGLCRTIARRRREQGLPFTPAWVFASGYVVLWTLTGSVAYAADLAIQSLPRTFPLVQIYGNVIAGGTLVAAGLYQLTPLKDRCLSQCRSPLGFLLTSWRDGPFGAFRMGLHHGAYCFGCCWSLMAVLFVVGTMNLVWMGLLAIIIVLEKLVPYGVTVGKVTGLSLIGFGLAVGCGVVVLER